MSSAKWRPFCLGLNELKEHLPKNQQRPEKLVTLNLPKRIVFYCSCRWTETVSMILKSLKTIGRQFDNFVVTGGSCHHDNLRCHQWRQSCRIDNLLFSAIRIKSGYWFLRRHISVKASQITSNPTVWAKGNSVPQQRNKEPHYWRFVSGICRWATWHRIQISDASINDEFPSVMAPCEIIENPYAILNSKKSNALLWTHTLLVPPSKIIWVK